MQYFGTDGIRGQVGKEPMTEEFCRRLGIALVHFLEKQGITGPRSIVLGRDTRESGEKLARAIREGLGRNHILIYNLGVVPTPVVSQSVIELHAHLGIMITASHNPATDNGIKLFDQNGVKFAIETEKEIEALIAEADLEEVVSDIPGTYLHDGAGHYINRHRTLMDVGVLKEWKIVLDTAHGATSFTSPSVLNHFGADLVQIGDTPDGKNINQGVGSEHPERLAEKVLAAEARLGIAHDGDGDRLVLVDETGSVVSGEEILGLLALDALEQGKLANNTLVTTIQSNLGLDLAIRAAGGEVERVGVGDRHVLHRMLEGGFNLGGESSGHIIFSDECKAGDGLLAALKVIEVMNRTGRTLSALRKRVTLIPQETQNLKLQAKKTLAECPYLGAAIKTVETRLADRGRVLVRFSGTEPKLRLLVECTDTADSASAMEALIAAAKEDLEVVE